mmetsp:Transcript_21092/g.21210  ORF Transcript_21092/g.21210 Transcript_21092/m.21210 type:complete len:134 (-) Transcript_21092:167-568(-)|eukprot:CAMPEP_0182416874 /NCGR_PEP_ID=MMETSP1167-20130531/1259_1 /TAXON_ID=2988 /ORGANISM="Mallomonas Sp, Strain CCMP3275" /LENGTH=133 /DNA_ID=CAMNT_0024590011 /DNA_START=82 /DNA_END=483 /DNA_ORIENTATION=-
MGDVQQIIDSNNIVVFASSSCPFCQQASAALKAAGYPCEVVNVTSEQKTALQSLTGSSSVPNIWVKGTYVGGANDGPEHWMGIMKLIQNGGLQKLLNGEKLTDGDNASSNTAGNATAKKSGIMDMVFGMFRKK